MFQCVDVFLLQAVHDVAAGLDLVDLPDHLPNGVKGHLLALARTGIAVCAPHGVEGEIALQGHGQRVGGVVALPGFGPLVLQHACRLAREGA